MGGAVVDKVGPVEKLVCDEVISPLLLFTIRFPSDIICAPTLLSSARSPAASPVDADPYEDEEQED
jgi:hypothetical protein